MNTYVPKTFRCWTLLLCCMLLTAAHAQDVKSPFSTDSTASGTTTTFSSDEDHDDFWAEDHDDTESSEHHHRHQHHGHRSSNPVVSIGRKADLPAGQRADSVVAIFGSATSAGDVDDAVVSVLGSTHVTGKVGDSAVAVMGSVYVNGEVDGDVVAVMGNVELGPDAKVHGDVVVVGGELTSDPKAIVDGHVQNVLGMEWGDFSWLRPWFERCLLYGRPLAFAPGLGWAWGIALGLLALYLFLAFVFRGAVDKCVQTLETEPGHSILAALLLTLAVPVLFVLLFITVLGIAAVPFLAIAVICAAVFGKVVVLAAIGRRCTPMLANDPTVHTVVGVLVGGLIAMVLYTIPVVGFIVYKLLELLGLGVVAYALLISVRAGRQARAAGGGAGVAGGAGAGIGGGAASAGATGGGFGGGTGPAGTAMGGGAGARGSFDGASEAAGPSGSAGQPPLNVAALPRAGFGIRMGALLLDVVLIGILLHRLDGANVELLALAAYGAVMWKLKASTIGGIICGLQVVRLDGRPIDWPTAIVRALGCFLSLAVVGLGFIWIAIDNDKQSWHDKIAGTVVVRAPKGASLL
jgi:RDD family